MATAPGISNVVATAECLRPVAWGSTIGIVPNDTAFPRNVGYNPGDSGQGSPVPDPAQCAAEPLYKWVDAFSGLDLSAHGTAVVERWRYWDGQFRSMRATARLNCAWAKKQAAFSTLRELLPHQDDADDAEASTEASTEASKAHARTVVLPVWKNLVAATSEMFVALLESTTNVGEMGVVADLLVGNPAHPALPQLLPLLLVCSALAAQNHPFEPR